MNSSILKRFVFALSVVFLISCDNDYTNIGADIIDDDIHHNGIQKHIVNVIAFDKATSAVQANNLPVNSIGGYDNPVFGKTIAHFVTQLELASENPTFSTGIQIDSVYLYVPYFSNLESTSDDGTGSYSLDSIYGKRNARMRLSVYENGYFLRTTDPATPGEAQKYFTDDKQLVEANRGATRLNDGASDQNEEFYFNTAEKQIKSNAGTVKQRLAPGIFLDLNKDFFMQKIFQAPTGKLINNNVFKDYFRGIYFNIEQTGDLELAMAKFNEGKIVIEYKEDTYDENGAHTGKADKTLTLNMKGNTINFFDNTFKPDYLSGINTSDEVFGDDRLYVKGGNGSFVFINIPDSELDFLREEVTGQKVLINEANLTFYVDQSAMAPSTGVTGNKEPERVYLYDVKNKRPLFDYYTDVSVNNTNAKLSKFVHGGIIERDENGRGKRYKIRITNHISNLIAKDKDSTNVTLGLVVTDNINVVTNAALRNTFDVNSAPNEGEGRRTPVKTLPVSSVISPVGTILYGSKPGTNVPEDKRLKLEIFYTKPN